MEGTEFYVCGECGVWEDDQGEGNRCPDCNRFSSRISAEDAAEDLAAAQKRTAPPGFYWMWFAQGEWRHPFALLDAPGVEAAAEKFGVARWSEDTPFIEFATLAEAEADRAAREAEYREGVDR